VEWERLSFLRCPLAVKRWCDSIKLERSTYPAVGFADTLAVTGMKLGMVGAAAARCRQRARLSNLRCGFGSALRRLLVRALQLSIKTRLAHSACVAAIALREVMTSGWTIKIRAAHYVCIRDGDCFRPALGALLTNDLVTPDAESGHSPPRRAGWVGRSRRQSSCTTKICANTAWAAEPAVCMLAAGSGLRHKACH
jgi:hypothetical protein